MFQSERKHQGREPTSITSIYQPLRRKLFAEKKKNNNEGAKTISGKMEEAHMRLQLR